MSKHPARIAVQITEHGHVGNKVTTLHEGDLVRDDEVVYVPEANVERLRMTLARAFELADADERNRLWQFLHDSIEIREVF